MADQPMCSACNMPKPSFWCWDGRDIGCGVSLPPKWASEDPGAFHAWRLAQKFDQRLRLLEGK